MLRKLKSKSLDVYYNFKYGISNLFTWFKIIWSNRDYDQWYIYEILKFKLERQSKYIRNHDTIESNKEISDKINLIVKLIKLEQEDYYSNEYSEYCKVEYNLDFFNRNIVEERFEDYFKKYKRQYKILLKTYPELKEESKECIAINLGQQNQNRCKELIFKLLSRNINTFWD
jgi:hypothetical protein